MAVHLPNGKPLRFADLRNCAPLAPSSDDDDDDDELWFGRWTGQQMHRSARWARVLIDLPPGKRAEALQLLVEGPLSGAEISGVEHLPGVDVEAGEVRAQLMHGCMWSPLLAFYLLVQQHSSGTIFIPVAEQCGSCSQKEVRKRSRQRELL